MTDKMTLRAKGNTALMVGQEGDSEIYRVVQVDNQGRIFITSDGGGLPVEIQRKTLTPVTATIPNGAALSSEVVINGASMVIILMPAAWTAADLTFQIREPVTAVFRDLFDESGSEVIETVAALRALPAPPELMAADTIRIRSGTTGTPVLQGAERAIVLLLKG